MSEQAKPKTPDAWKPRLDPQTKPKFYQAMGIMQAQQTGRLTQQEAFNKLVEFFIENHDKLAHMQNVS